MCLTEDRRKDSSTIVVPVCAICECFYVHKVTHRTQTSEQWFPVLLLTYFKQTHTHTSALSAVIPRAQKEIRGRHIKRRTNKSPGSASCCQHSQRHILWQIFFFFYQDQSDVILQQQKKERNHAFVNPVVFIRKWGKKINREAPHYGLQTTLIIRQISSMPSVTQNQVNSRMVIHLNL